MAFVFIVITHPDNSCNGRQVSELKKNGTRNQPLNTHQYACKSIKCIYFDANFPIAMMNNFAVTSRQSY